MQRTLIIQWFVYISIHSPCQAVYTAKQWWRDGGVGKNIVDVHSRWCSGKSSACPCRRCERCGFDLWVGKIPWSRKWQPTPVFLLRKSHGQRSLASYSPWGCKGSDTTEQLSTWVGDMFVWFFCHPLPERVSQPLFLECPWFQQQWKSSGARKWWGLLVPYAFSNSSLMIPCMWSLSY